MSSSPTVRRTNVNAAAWEPCVTSDGRTIGDAEWLRRRTEPGWSHHGHAVALRANVLRVYLPW